MNKKSSRFIWMVIQTITVSIFFFSSVILFNTQVVMADTNPWTAAQSMQYVRGKFGSVRLSNGKVLVAAGANSTGSLYNSWELYDPSANSWTLGSSTLNVKRIEFPTVLLSDGKVLVAGGVNSSGAAEISAEVFNPANNSWTTTGNLTTASAYETATLLNNGKVLIAGGTQSTTASLNVTSLYDPSNGTFTSAGIMNSARRNHTATLLTNGKVLITGGSSGDGVTTSLASIDLYDSSSGWAPAAGLNSMIYSRHSHTATLLADGRVLVAGGATTCNQSTNTCTLPSVAELYNPNTGTWSATGSMITPRYFHEAVLLNNGKVLVVGGADANSNVLNSAELYDPNSGTWSSVGYPMSSARMFHSAVMLTNNNVLVIGGSSTGSNALKTVDVYNTTSKSDQTISVTTTAPPNAAYQSTFTVAATSSSGLTVTYSSGSTSVCTNSGATFTMVSGTGTCVVQFDQSGDSTYNPAPQIIENVGATKLDQTITVTTHAPPNSAYNTSFTVTATAPGGSVSYSSGSTSICTNSGATFTMVSGTGTCVVRYDRASDANYNAAPQVTDSTLAGKANQTITFEALSDKKFRDPDVTVTASASSGLPVSFSVGGSDQCTITGNSVHITAAGSCTVTAAQEGNGNYFAATSVSRTFTIAKASVTITLAGLTRTYNGSPIEPLVTTDPPGLTVLIHYKGTGTTTYPECDTPPTEVGTYIVTVDVNEEDYEGTENGTMTILSKEIKVYLPVLIH